MRALQNSIQKAGKWDRLVNKKPPNPMEDWREKPISQKRVTVLRALAAPLGIGCRKRSIDKKFPSSSRKQRRKNKRLGLGFFSSNPEPALPLQKKIEQFNSCELTSGQVSRSFLVILRDFVDLVYSCSRGSRSRGLDVYPERGNSLIGSMYTINKANLISSMHTAGKVVLCTAERIALCTTGILVCQVDNWCR